ncbi:hypothetical protein [Lacticaseibacillus porcinae]|uniref:hypothetical protein n=1 Tax=Lacticaseibacillus porcinae TaxID=1123687 RepID=UPI000F76EB1C|nr:hypothetical protein [Lacticaseibacillus porcinae]
MSTAMHLDLQLQALRTLMIRAPNRDWAQQHFVLCTVQSGLITDFANTTADLPKLVLLPQAFVAASNATAHTLVTFDGDVDTLPTISGFAAYTRNRELQGLQRKQLATLKSLGKRHLPSTPLGRWLQLIDQYAAGKWPFAAWQAQLKEIASNQASLTKPLSKIAVDYQHLAAEFDALATPQAIITHAALISVADNAGIFHLTLPTDDVAQLGEFVRHFTNEEEHL